MAVMTKLLRYLYWRAVCLLLDLRFYDWAPLFI